MNTLTNLKYTLAVTAGLCSSFAYAQNHPHIILIMTDQQRADAIGCMGNDAVISPNLDALAAEGTLFMNGYSSCPSSTYKPQNKMFHFCKTFCSKITLVNTIQNVI